MDTDISCVCLWGTPLPKSSCRIVEPGSVILCRLTNAFLHTATLLSETGTLYVKLPFLSFRSTSDCFLFITCTSTRPQIYTSYSFFLLKKYILLKIVILSAAGILLKQLLTPENKIKHSSLQQYLKYHVCFLWTHAFHCLKEFSIYHCLCSQTKTKLLQFHNYCEPVSHP